jgi:hypothetical protein
MKKVIQTEEELRAFVDPLIAEGKYIFDIYKGANGFVVQWQEHKTYTAHDGKVFPDEVWITETGEMKQIQDIEPEHCRNIIRMILRKDRELGKVIDNMMKQLAESMGIDQENPQVENEDRVLH